MQRELVHTDKVSKAAQNFGVQKLLLGIKQRRSLIDHQQERPPIVDAHAPLAIHQAARELQWQILIVEM